MRRIKTSLIRERRVIDQQLSNWKTCARRESLEIFGRVDKFSAKSYLTDDDFPSSYGDSYGKIKSYGKILLDHFKLAKSISLEVKEIYKLYFLII